MKPSTKLFRNIVFHSMGSELRNTFRPTVAACTIVLRSPRWVTQKGTVARMDADNRIKPLLDAIQLATGVPDQVFVDIRVMKQYGESEETIVYLAAMK